MDLLAAMRVFAVVARSGGFSPAARELGLSPSSVARQMDALEAAVGVRLLVRSTRRIDLTEQGRRLLTQGGGALRAFEAALARLLEEGAAARGVLRVTAAPSFGRSVLPVILEPFLAAHPGIDLDLLLTDALLDLPEAGVDLAIRVGDPNADGDLIVHDLLPMRRILCAAPGYLEANGKPTTPADLERHACLLFRAGDQPIPWTAKTATWTFRRASAVERVTVQGRMSASDADSLVAAARSNLGIAMMPDWMLVEDLRAGRLVRILEGHTLGDADDPKTLHLAYPLHHRDTPRVDALRRHLQDWFADFEV